MSRKNRIAAMLLCCILVIGLFPANVSAAGSEEPFTDVSPSDWFYEAVLYTYQNGLMNGTGGSTFSPHATATRAMIVTVLYRMEKEPTVSAANPFLDVVPGSYCDDAVAWAASHKIVTGYSSTKFGPNDNITREQMATILYRYANYLNYNTDSQASISNYSDANAVSSWARIAMQWAVGSGLISGTSSTTLSPTSTATRAQIAMIFMRFCKRDTSATTRAALLNSIWMGDEQTSVYYEFLGGGAMNVRCGGGDMSPVEGYTYTVNGTRVVISNSRQGSSFAWDYSGQHFIRHFEDAEEGDETLIPLTRKEFYTAWAQNMESFQSSAMQAASTQTALNSASAECYAGWDNLLNAVYQYLEQSLSAEALSKLRQEEAVWITQKEAAMDAAGAPYSSGTIRTTKRNCAGADSTRLRIYELIDEISG